MKTYELEEFESPSQGKLWRVWINDNDLIFFDHKTGKQVVDALNIAEHVRFINRKAKALHGEMSIYLDLYAE